MQCNLMSSASIVPVQHCILSQHQLHHETHGCVSPSVPCLGSPVPSISWRRVDGSAFPRKVDARKASGVLEIPYFQQEDTGTYECVAENPRGMNTVKGKLSFYGRSIEQDG